MTRDFNKWNEEAKVAELLTVDILSKLTDEYSFTWVGDVKEYRYKGDIIATAADGREIMIEVKNDSCIATTGNVLCEEEVYVKDSDRYNKGNMYCDSDIFAVVSQEERLIYFFDFKRLKEIYKKGYYKVIPHLEEITYCYLLELCRAKQWGAFITKIKY